MEDKTFVCIIAGIFAAIMTPITLFFSTAGGVCLAFAYASYTVFNCVLSFIIGFGAMLAVFEGNFKVDENYGARMESNRKHKENMARVRARW